MPLLPGPGPTVAALPLILLRFLPLKLTFLLLFACARVSASAVSVFSLSPCVTSANFDAVSSTCASGGGQVCSQSQINAAPKHALPCNLATTRVWTNTPCVNSKNTSAIAFVVTYGGGADPNPQCSLTAPSNFHGIVCCTTLLSSSLSPTSSLAPSPAAIQSDSPTLKPTSASPTSSAPTSTNAPHASKTSSPLSSSAAPSTHAPTLATTLTSSPAASPSSVQGAQATAQPVTPTAFPTPLQTKVPSLAVLAASLSPSVHSNSSAAKNSTVGPTGSKGCVPRNATLPPSGLWGWQGWFVLADIVLLFVVLFHNLLRIEFAMVTATWFFVVTSIILATDWTAGFANTSVLAIATLLAISDAFASTGGLDHYVIKFIGRPKTLGGALFRMMVPGMFIAAWISSTAVVAIFLPIVTRWSLRINKPASQLLMPLSYAVHLGGTCTLIGTTTNLVIIGYAQTYWCESYSIFMITPAGVPVALCGMGLLILLAPKALPDAKEFERRTKYAGEMSADKPFVASKWLRAFRAVKRRIFGPKSESEPVSFWTPQAREAMGQDFYWHATVEPTSSAIGKTIEQAGLRHLGSLFVVGVERGNDVFTAVASDFVLQANDVISFAGVSDDFVGFAASKGLAAVTVDSMQSLSASDPISSHIVEAIVSGGSSLIDKTPKEVGFRGRFNASIVAIHRAGQRMAEMRLGQLRLKVGDVLVLLTGENFNWDACAGDLKPRSNNNYKPISDAVVDPSGPISSNHDTLDEESGEADYLFCMRVMEQAPLKLMASLAGQTVDQANLRDVPGATLVAVEREGVLVRVVGSDFVLNSGDLVWFVGPREGLASLRLVPGIEDAEAAQVKRLKAPAPHRRLIEVVVSPTSDLLYKTAKETRFRTRFEAVIVAVQRHGTRLYAQLGNLVLKPGDVLILDAGPLFIKRFGDSPNFLVVSEIPRSEPPQFGLFFFALFIVTSMVVLAASVGQIYSMDLLVFTVAALALLLASGVTTWVRMYRAIDWSIIITIAAAFGLATALTNSNVAGVIGVNLSQGMISIGAGQIGVLAVLMIFTEILAAFITSKASALVVFPIAAAAAATLNIPHNKVLIALMLGASDYTTPQGHQINLMIYGPGAYKFVDYQKLGIPLEIGLNIVQIVVLAYLDFAYITIPCAFAFLVACIVVDHVIVERRPVTSLAIFHPLAVWRSFVAFVADMLPRNHRVTARLPNWPRVSGQKSESKE